MLKIVNFNKYCKKCVFKELSDLEYPCEECVSTPAIENSRIPVKFKEKGKDQGET